MKNSSHILKYVFILAILVLYIIATVNLSQDTAPIINLAIYTIPFFLIGLFLTKEKIWYTWFLLPPLFLPLGEQSLYKYLVIIGGTLPIYFWYVFKKNISITWNHISILDYPIILLFIHVLFVFFNNPFGLGMDLTEDYYGGRGYMLFLGAFLSYIAFSTLSTNSQQVGKLLKWAIPIIIIFTLIATIKNFLSESNQPTAEVAFSTGEEEREKGLFVISILLLQLLIIKYNIKDFIKKVWPTIIGLSCCLGILISGTRGGILRILAVFLGIHILYRRWAMLILIPSIGLIILLLLSAGGILREAPYSIQRCLTPLSFLDLNPHVSNMAQMSIDWRTEMWKWALDDRELFIKDKIWGDGFSLSTNIIKAGIYRITYNIVDTSSKQGNIGYAFQGMWHSSPISTIHTLGYVGLSLFSILCVIGLYYSWTVSEIYKNSPYRIGILYISLVLISDIIEFWITALTAAHAIPSFIINITIIKLLYCCAKKEGLYITKSTRKEYIPLSCRTAQAE